MRQSAMSSSFTALEEVPGPLQMVNCPADSFPESVRNGRLPLLISMRAVSPFAAPVCGNASNKGKAAARKASFMSAPTEWQVSMQPILPSFQPPAQSGGIRKRTALRSAAVELRAPR
jgi:hypothetical protein